LFALVALSIGSLAGQTTAPAPAPAPAPQAPATPAEPAIDDEVVVLSPFQVTADAFNGYYASQTLAGSRLKMNIDEVASSIQIVTPEFMQDVGASSINELFLFTTSTEASGINGNFSDFSAGTTSTNDEGTRINPQGSQRVRGISGADLTRNYFLSLIPSDRFNTDSTEINRGANAILFGLGSPAGIVNTQLASARFKNSRQARVEVDDQGSLRTELDVNQVVVPGKLAVRVAALRDDTNFYQEPAFEKDERLFGAINARPWKNAQIRGFVEDGGREANRPNTIPPSSTIASWFANQPLMVQRMRAVLAATPGTSGLTVPDNYPLIYSPIAQSWRPNNTNSYLTTASIPNDVKLAILRNAVIYQDNNATHPRMIFHPNMSRQIAAVYLPGAINPGGAVGDAAAVESNISPAIANPPLAMNPDGVGTAPTYNYFAPEQPWRTSPVLIPVSLTNLDMFDFTQQMLSGNAAFQNDSWMHYNAVFEQTFLDNRAGFELAYDKQSYSRDAYVPFQGFTGIFVDLMQDYLGQTNPNLGRPFVMDRASLRLQDDERESFRATGFYRFDPERHWKGSRLARWFGQHTFTGVFSTYDQQQDNSSVGQYYRNPTGGFVFNAADPAGSNRRKVNNIIYLGDSILGATSESGVRLQPLTDQRMWQPGRKVSLRTYNTTTRTYELIDLETQALVEDYARETQAIDTIAATWNASFLDNHVIGLWGWRQDSVVSERRQAVTGADLLADMATLDTPAALLSRVDRDFRTTSWSVVAKLPERWLRLPLAGRLNAYYGESENFSLSATANDIFGAQLPSPAGNTKEYGVMLNLLDSKLVLRLNRYETQVVNSATDSKYSVLANQGILKPYEFLLEAKALGNQGATTPNYALTMDALAKLQAILPASTIAAAGLASAPVGLDYNRSDVPNLGDTQDVVGKGTELELIYNPTPGWRLALNVANQETIVDNYAPRLEALWALVDPILGPNGVVGKLRYFNDPSTSPPNFMSYAAPVAGDNQMTVAQWIETNVLSSYRNQKKQEGRVSTEQRAWRVNLVTNYTFREGRLRGFGAGTAVRWQDGAVIGYPTELVGDTLVADIANPHIAPSITNIDAWLRYNRRFAKGRLDWTIELRVQNLNHTAQDLIPVRSELTTDYRVAQYRVGPPRVWSLANSFKF
jgi:hypothetical protein